MYKKTVIDLSSLADLEFRRFLDSFDNVAVDCDGVLWISGNAIPGSSDVLQKFRDFGKRIFYVTNNSTKTRDEFVEGARRLGFEAHKNEVISTAYLTACYLKSINFQGKVYVIGSTGITGELDEIGVQHSGVGPDVMTTLDEALKFNIDPEIKAVVVGMDKDFSYGKMLKAATYLNNPNVMFLGTNTDERFPLDGAKVMPGTGSLVKSVECCSLRQALVMGKPSDFVGRALVLEHGIDPLRTLMIGDRLNTDIALASRCNFQSLLVLSGVTSSEELQELKTSQNSETIVEEEIPDFYLNKLGDLLPQLNRIIK